MKPRQAASQGDWVVKANQFHEHITDQVTQILYVACLISERHDFDVGPHLDIGFGLSARLFGERRGCRWVGG